MWGPSLFERVEAHVQILGSRTSVVRSEQGAKSKVHIARHPIANTTAQRLQSDVVGKCIAAYGAPEVTRVVARKPSRATIIHTHV